MEIMLAAMTPGENVYFLSVNECGEEKLSDGNMTLSGLVSYYHLCFYKMKT